MTLTNPTNIQVKDEPECESLVNIANKTMEKKEEQPIKKMNKNFDNSKHNNPESAKNQQNKNNGNNIPSDKIEEAAKREIIEIVKNFFEEKNKELNKDNKTLEDTIKELNKSIEGYKEGAIGKFINHFSVKDDFNKLVTSSSQLTTKFLALFRSVSVDSNKIDSTNVLRCADDIDKSITILLGDAEQLMEKITTIYAKYKGLKKSIVDGLFKLVVTYFDSDIREQFANAGNKINVDVLMGIVSTSIEKFLKNFVKKHPDDNDKDFKKRTQEITKDFIDKKMVMVILREALEEKLIDKVNTLFKNNNLEDVKLKKICQAYLCAVQIDQGKPEDENNTAKAIEAYAKKLEKINKLVKTLAELKMIDKDKFSKLNEIFNKLINENTHFTLNVINNFHSALSKMIKRFSDMLKTQSAYVFDNLFEKFNNDENQGLNDFIDYMVGEEIKKHQVTDNEVSKIILGQWLVKDKLIIDENQKSSIKIINEVYLKIIEKEKSKMFFEFTEKTLKCFDFIQHPIVLSELLKYIEQVSTLCSIDANNFNYEAYEKLINPLVDSTRISNNNIENDILKIMNHLIKDAEPKLALGDIQLLLEKIILIIQFSNKEFKELVSLFKIEPTLNHTEVNNLIQIIRDFSDDIKALKSLIRKHDSNPAQGDLGKKRKQCEKDLNDISNLSVNMYGIQEQDKLRNQLLYIVDVGNIGVGMQQIYGDYITYPLDEVTREELKDLYSLTVERLQANENIHNADDVIQLKVQLLAVLREIMFRTTAQYPDILQIVAILQSINNGTKDIALMNLNKIAKDDVLGILAVMEFIFKHPIDVCLEDTSVGSNYRSFFKFIDIPFRLSNKKRPDNVISINYLSEQPHDYFIQRAEEMKNDVLGRLDRYQELIKYVHRDKNKEIYQEIIAAIQVIKLSISHEIDVELDSLSVKIQKQIQDSKESDAQSIKYDITAKILDTYQERLNYIWHQYQNQLLKYLPGSSSSQSMDLFYEINEKSIKTADIPSGDPLKSNASKLMLKEMDQRVIFKDNKILGNKKLDNQYMSLKMQKELVPYIDDLIVNLSWVEAKKSFQYRFERTAICKAAEDIFDHLQELKNSLANGIFAEQLYGLKNMLEDYKCKVYKLWSFNSINPFGHQNVVSLFDNGLIKIKKLIEDARQVKVNSDGSTVKVFDVLNFYNIKKIHEEESDLKLELIQIDNATNKIGDELNILQLKNILQEKLREELKYITAEITENNAKLNQINLKINTLNLKEKENTKNPAQDLVKAPNLSPHNDEGFDHEEGNSILGMPFSISIPSPRALISTLSNWWFKNDLPKKDHKIVEVTCAIPREDDGEIKNSIQTIKNRNVQLKQQKSSIEMCLNNMDLFLKNPYKLDSNAEELIKIQQELIHRERTIQNKLKNINEESDFKRIAIISTKQNRSIQAQTTTNDQIKGKETKCCSVFTQLVTFFTKSYHGFEHKIVHAKENLEHFMYRQNAR